MTDQILREPPKAWVEGEDSRITLRLGLPPREPMVYIQCMSTDEAKRAAHCINSMCENAAKIGAKQSGTGDGQFSETITVDGRSIRYAAPTMQGIQQLKYAGVNQITFNPSDADRERLKELLRNSCEPGMVRMLPAVDLTQLETSISKVYEVTGIEGAAAIGPRP